MSADRLLAADPVPAAIARDESFVVRLTRPASLAAFEKGAYFATYGGTGNERALGTWVSGRPLIDPASGREVVVRPEALREYYATLGGRTIAEADAESARVLARAERTGDLDQLNAIHTELKLIFGESAGARLDEPGVTAFCPRFGVTEYPATALRRLIAGDDELWKSYLINGDLGAFATLAADASIERFQHPIDMETGMPSASSLLRQREHRRVLMRRTRTAVTFLPQIPMRADLADAAYAAGATYELSLTKRFAGGVRDVLTEGGQVAKFVRRVAGLRVGDDSGDGGAFLGGVRTAPAGGTPDPPRIVNITPPDGESFIDPTTDWEDPDNQFTTPIPSRRSFVVRLRFSRPLDPRTVDAAHVTLKKTATLDSVGNETPVSVPVATGVWLSQSRMGEVLVEVTPFTNLDPQSKYAVEVLGTVKALDGTPLGETVVFYH